MKTVRLVLLLGFLGFLFMQTSAQTEKDDEEIIRVETQLIDVPIFITDQNGKPILNLKKNNFLVYEDGKLQEIAEFSSTEVPFEVALLLDTSGSTRADLSLIQRAAADFIASLRPGDRVAIIAYQTEKTTTEAYSVSRILTRLTDDRAQLRTALETIQTSNSTPFYDSLLQIAERIFNEQPTKKEFRARRAVVALTDGVDSASVAEFDEVKESFERLGVISYFIQVSTRDFFEDNLLGDCRLAMRFSTAQIRRYYRTYYPKANVEKTFDFCQLGDFEKLAISKGLYELADKQMHELAKISGGNVFPIAGLSEARRAFRQIAAEIGTKYSLGYYSSNDKRDGSYRRIKVELKGVPAGTIVRAREGYTAPTK
jgi:Ca-activated chloride channel family protein